MRVSDYIKIYEIMIKLLKQNFEMNEEISEEDISLYANKAVDKFAKKQ